jgi:putative heme degradation protein
VLGELRAAWDGLADPAEFAGMLAQSGLSRAELFALLGGSRAVRVDRGGLEVALRSLALSRAPIVLSVANAGARLTCTGPLVRVGGFSGDLRVEGARFTSHLAIAPAAGTIWVTRYPTQDGRVTAIEFCDRSGDGALAVFPAAGQDTVAWRRLLEAVTVDHRTRAGLACPVSESEIVGPCARRTP